jgi:hypothetical protein
MSENEAVLNGSSISLRLFHGDSKVSYCRSPDGIKSFQRLQDIGSKESWSGMRCSRGNTDMFLSRFLA